MNPPRPRKEGQGTFLDKRWPGLPEDLKELYDAELLPLPAPKFNSIEKLFQYHLRSARTVIFTQTRCKASLRTKRLLRSKTWKREARSTCCADVVLDQVDEGPALYNMLVSMTGRMSVPYVFIKEKFIGGWDEVSDLEQKGLLDEMTKP